MSNSLDPDQARCFVRPGLGQNCLQRLSADNTRRQRVIKLSVWIVVMLYNNLSIMLGQFPVFFG